MAHDIKGFPFVGLSTIEMSQPNRMPIVHYDEFLTWNSATATGSWSIAAGAASYQAGLTGTGTFGLVDDFDGGAIILTTTTGAADENALQLNGGSFFCTAAPDLFKPARQMRCGLRFKTGSITLATQYFGMFVKEAVLSSGGTMTNSPATSTQPVGIGFSIVNGVVNYISKIGSTATTATSVGFGSIAINTMYTLEIGMDNRNVFSFYVNGVKYLDLSSTSIPLSATVGLSPAFGIKNGDGTARTMTVDSLYAAVEAPVNGR